MSIELAMENAKLQSEIKEVNSMMLQLRKFLAGSLCTVCGDPLGTDEEITQNDNDETMHAHCEDASDI